MGLKIILGSAAALSMAATGALAERGSDGQLNLLYWQAASILNPYLSGGTKDLEASSMILDPLANYDEAGNMVPVLVTEIPTVENGGVSEDLRTITWKRTFSEASMAVPDSSPSPWLTCGSPMEKSAPSTCTG